MAMYGWLLPFGMKTQQVCVQRTERVAGRRDTLGVDGVVQLVFLVLAAGEQPVDDDCDVARLIEDVSRVGLLALAAIGAWEIRRGHHIAVTPENVRHELDCLARAQEPVAVNQQGLRVVMVGLRVPQPDLHPAWRLPVGRVRVWNEACRIDELVRVLLYVEGARLQQLVAQQVFGRHGRPPRKGREGGEQ
jgi:hypothetical protein